MPRYRLIAFTLLVVLLFTVAAAQNDAPVIGTAQENACNEGGLFFHDGLSLCETEWHWECGWYVANWQNTGAPIPDWCGVNYLTPIVTPVPDFPGCVQGSANYIKFGNQLTLPATSIAYTDSACTSAVGTYTYPLVYATSITDAIMLCISIGSTFRAGPYGAFVYECN